MDPVVHFELPYDDRERIANFYRTAFGWELQMLGPEMGNYVVARTGRPGGGPPAAEGAVPGVIGGGFYQRTADPDTQYPSVVIAVADVRAAMKKVRDAGGRVVGEPMPIPGVGDYVSFFDTENNRLSMLQPQPMPK